MRRRDRLYPALGLVALLVPTTAASQILEEWSIVYSGRSYDYLVTDRGLEHVATTEDGIEITRVVVSRMLVRYIDPARLQLIQERAAEGRRTSGYDDYASSTFVVEAQCATRLLRITETVDYDDSGTVLERRSHPPGWMRTPRGWESRAVSAVLARTCRRSG